MHFKNAYELQKKTVRPAHFGSQMRLCNRDQRQFMVHTYFKLRQIRRHVIEDHMIFKPSHA